VLARALDRLVAAVANEASTNPQLADALSAALTDTRPRTTDDKPPRGARRKRGPWDPFAIYAEHGETGLRERLSRLGLEELRDMIAEHGMDTDRLAMKWRNPERVVGRIVDRVVDRAAKGDGFRPPAS